MSDTFHENAKLGHIDALFEVMNNCPQHTFQILTKRPQNIPSGLNWTKNIHLGITVCTQKEALEKLPLFHKIPAYRTFISVEPMLENINLNLCLHCQVDPLLCWEHNRVDLVIVGGESGHNSRPIHPDWVRSIRDQCCEANVPFLFKQWGSGYDPTYSQYAAGFRDHDKKGGRILDGVTHDGEIK